MSISFFAGAECARAPLSQKLERKITFQSVGPSQSKLVADYGHILQARLHASILAIFAKGNKLRRRSVRALFGFQEAMGRFAHAPICAPCSSLTPMGIKLRK